MSSDPEIELWKRKRLIEMQKRLLAEKAKAENPESKAEGLKPSPTELLNRVYGERAWEVHNAAKQQYPDFIARFEKSVARLVSEGKLKGPVTGEQLLGFFQNLGLKVRLETKIRVLESGELKSIADKLKGD